MTDPTWLVAAWAEYGQRERVGTATNPRIARMFADAGHPGIASDETAWCAAFVGAVLERSGLRSTRSLAARSYLDWGEPLDAPRLGAVAVFARGADPASGHVAFCLGECGTGLVVLGGNQGDLVGVTLMPRARLLALRWPASEDGAGIGTSSPPSSTSALFDRCLAHVLAEEGGFTDDPYDSGGPTNFGLTLADLAAAAGEPLTSESRARLLARLRRIDPATVRAVYGRLYWTPSRAALLPPAIALMHFDAAVNMGLGTAARLLQTALAVAVDGDIGPVTTRAARTTPPRTLIARYAALRRARYRGLATFWRFGRGWLARVDRTEAAALSLIPPANPEGDPAMADDTTPTTQAPKWWAHSLTVWGTIVTTAATVLPIVGPLIGLDLTPQLVQALGDGVVEVVQAIGAVVGIIMTIWGRSRATGPLERRTVTLQL